MLNRISNFDYFFGNKGKFGEFFESKSRESSSLHTAFPPENFYAKGLKYASNVVVLLLLLVDDVLANKQRY